MSNTENEKNEKQEKEVLEKLLEENFFYIF
jgi:hypothetical protein